MRWCAHVLAYIGFRDEELRAQVILGNDAMVGQCYGAYSGENEVLGNFIRQRFDVDEENVGGADPGCALAVVGFAMGVGLTCFALALPIDEFVGRRAQSRLYDVSSTLAC
jgi:hypothetical protein